ncbi:MAG: hypothetical protein EHJ94_10420 [Deltaproteobacteria bacterium]|nr:MAG: hypothetical protein EHJ94_10420 [Deltaproteobacteria bacterium]
MFCCTDAGAIDITTQEGLINRDRIERLPRPQKVALTKALIKDRSRREKGQVMACPFLLKNRIQGYQTVRIFSKVKIKRIDVDSCKPEGWLDADDYSGSAPSSATYSSVLARESISAMAAVGC